MNSVFELDPNANQLNQLIEDGEIILFVGSGLSNSIYPKWHELIKDLCERCRVKPPVSLTVETPVEILIELAEKAQIRNESAFINVLKRHFAEPIDVKKKAYAKVWGCFR